jgi:hypothetical protein
MKKAVHIHSLVRVADRAALTAALQEPADRRPEPGQMLWAGRQAWVTGYRLSAGGRPSYVLKGAPGVFAEEWLDSI